MAYGKASGLEDILGKCTCKKHNAKNISISSDTPSFLNHNLRSLLCRVCKATFHLDHTKAKTTGNGPVL